MSFYNSNSEKGATLAKSKKKAAKQDEQILEYFKYRYLNDFTAHDVWYFYNCIWPITSVRRSIHNLWKDGKLIDTGEMRKGGYGKPNRVYKYNPKAK